MKLKKLIKQLFPKIFIKLIYFFLRIKDLFCYLIHKCLNKSGYIKDLVFLSIIKDWTFYINENLLPIVESSHEILEGNIFSKNKTTKNALNSLTNKRNNLYRVLKITKPIKILEIGFNSGFSTLLMKMIIPDSEITCIDINDHKYTIPCFNKISSDYDNIKLIPESSHDVALPILIKNKEVFDFIHIDGDHRLEGAKKDLDLCLRLSHKDTIILFDDTNLPHLNSLCSQYLRKGILEEFNFKGYQNYQKYKHRFFKVKF